MYGTTCGTKNLLGSGPGLGDHIGASQLGWAWFGLAQYLQEAGLICLLELDSPVGLTRHSDFDPFQLSKFIYFSMNTSGPYIPASHL